MHPIHATKNSPAPGIEPESSTVLPLGLRTLHTSGSFLWRGQIFFAVFFSSSIPSFKWMSIIHQSILFISQNVAFNCEKLRLFLSLVISLFPLFILTPDPTSSQSALSGPPPIATQISTLDLLLSLAKKAVEGYLALSGRLVGSGVSLRNTLTSNIKVSTSSLMSCSERG